MNVVLITIITLSALGALAAVILYFVAQKFKVYEDPRIDQVEEVLPAANCGGCGYPGCRAFAEAMVSSDDISNLYCPVGGAEVMSEAAKIVGKAVAEAAPQVAVVRCNGTCENRPRTNKYEGAENCTIAATLYGGETGCSYGCLGLGECVDACNFDAMYMDPVTGLPVVIEENCVACGACVEACPKDILELRNIGPKSRRIYVSCVNKDRGGPARKACSVACIGCGKCEQVCAFDAITIKDNLAYIDYEKCKLCRKCVEVCPTDAIHEINFPVRKPKPAADKKPAAQKPAVEKKAPAAKSEAAVKTEAKPKAEAVKKEAVESAGTKPKPETAKKESTAKVETKPKAETAKKESAEKTEVKPEAEKKAAPAAEEKKTEAKPAKEVKKETPAGESKAEKKDPEKKDKPEEK